MSSEGLHWSEIENKIPLIKTGMSKDEVYLNLGIPDREMGNDSFLLIFYEHYGGEITDKFYQIRLNENIVQKTEYHEW